MVYPITLVNPDRNNSRRASAWHGRPRKTPWCVPDTASTTTPRRTRTSCRTWRSSRRSRTPRPTSLLPRTYSDPAKRLSDDHRLDQQLRHPAKLPSGLSGEPDRFAACAQRIPSRHAFRRRFRGRLKNRSAWAIPSSGGCSFESPRPRCRGAQGELQRVFPDGQVSEYRDHGDPRVAAALDAALSYLDLTAWTALALGSVTIRNEVKR